MKKFYSSQTKFLVASLLIFGLSYCSSAKDCRSYLDYEKWLSYAQTDLEAAKSLNGSQERFVRQVLYLSEQCGEKALKAYLTFKNVSYEKTHYLDSLMVLCSNYDEEFIPLFPIAGVLSRYTRARYPESGAEIDDGLTKRILVKWHDEAIKFSTDSAIAQAEEVLEFVKILISFPKKELKFTPYKKWLYYAKTDLRTAKSLNCSEESFIRQALYFSQQCSEKALKAYLIHCGTTDIITHDLSILIDKCAQHDEEFNILKQIARELTPYAVKTRYPQTSFTLTESADGAIEHAEEVLEFVMNKIRELTTSINSLDKAIGA